MKEKENKKRREFLALGLLAGAGVLAGDTLVEALSGNDKKVRLITADGKVMEVDAQHIPASKNNEPLSNNALQQWLREEKNLKQDE